MLWSPRMCPSLSFVLSPWYTVSTIWHYPSALAEQRYLYQGQAHGGDGSGSFSSILDLPSPAIVVSYSRLPRTVILGLYASCVSLNFVPRYTVSASSGDVCLFLFPCRASAQLGTRLPCSISTIIASAFIASTGLRVY